MPLFKVYSPSFVVYLRYKISSSGEGGPTLAVPWFFDMSNKKELNSLKSIVLLTNITRSLQEDTL